MNPPIVLLDTPDTRIEVSVNQMSLQITIEGQLNEDTSLAPIAEFIRAHEKRSNPVEMVEFDLGKLRKLNSCGVREWLLFLDQTTSRRKYRFLDISEPFVELASIIRNLLGKSSPELVQFQAPYYCQICDAKQVIHLRPKEVVPSAQGWTIPAQRCPSCSNAMEFDSIESEYFAFLKQLK